MGRRISKPLFRVAAGFAVVLLFLVAVFSARVLEHRVRPVVRLEPATLRFLAALRGKVVLTYFGTGRDAMPSSMKDVGDSVRGVLAAMKAAAPDRVDFRVVDPDADALGAPYASRHGASPIRVRRVLADESSEAAVWSSLVIAWENHPDGLIQGIKPADLPHLEELIVQTLAGAETPPRPTVAIAAPSRGYEQVRALAGTIVEGRVVPVDFTPSIRIPPEADLLLWIDPRNPTPEDAQVLEAFLASGRSVILAGSSYSVVPAAGSGGAKFSATRSGSVWHDFLRGFGLAQDEMVLLDKNHGEIAWHGEGGPVKVDAPFQIRVIPSCLDTRNLLGPNTGVLLLSSVGAVRWDPAAVARSGRRVDVIATTSESVTAIEVPDEEFDASRFEGARALPKQPWLVRLAATDAWKGDLVLAGSTMLFHDDAYAQGMNANQSFLRTLLKTFVSPDRLARAHVPKHEPERVASLSGGSRFAWRVVTVALVPLILLGLAVLGRRSRPLGTRASPWRTRAAGGAAAFVIVLVVAAGLGADCPARVDLTEGAVNTPSKTTEDLLAAIRAGLRVELVASDAARLPPAQKRVEAQVIATLRELGIRPSIVRPDDLDEAGRRKLAETGAEPFDVEGVANDASAPARIWSALELSHAGRTEVIPRIDSGTVRHLDFLLAAAFERLATGRTPVVGILSDLPRLSPAEAHDYQQKGYTAPIGSDVYSDVKRMFSDYGYRVIYINPETQTFPDSMDLLVWLQPRYVQKAYPQFTEYLRTGGRAIVALQHYNVLQRQFRGTAFKTVYWPQPQFHRFNEYLELLGIRQLGEKRSDKSGEIPGEVLFDRQHSDLVLRTEVNRSAFKDNDLQQVSRPFLIKVAGAGLDPSSVITSKLSGLQFIWGSRFLLDQARLARAGISAQVLATTSPRAWTYSWKGGFIPDESFAEPAELLPGPQPLVVMLEGRFPGIAFGKDDSGRDAMTIAGPDSAPTSASSRPRPSAPGELLLVGCSEMFKNEHLRDPGYQHDQFLLNAAALLAYGPALAAVQARTYAPKVLSYQPPDVVARWRIVTLAAPPLAFMLVGLAGVFWSSRVHRRRREKLTGAPPGIRS